ncbi:hypothetical protein B9479_005861 [Cryptococcus floricola]|uniref:Uncharacterized protein n=1 Tax=Cryptococcus floricola TaxID=2591691 RepID=A0A5D3ATY2_9TREE|nr:hypothetical protein B9479_005861 [Cryptococcus floricola]
MPRFLFSADTLDDAPVEFHEILERHFLRSPIVADQGKSSVGASPDVAEKRSGRPTVAQKEDVQDIHMSVVFYVITIVSVLTLSQTSTFTSSADAPLEQIMYLLSDRPSIDQADKQHLVGQYLKISGYFRGMSSPSKLIEDYYRS